MSHLENTPSIPSNVLYNQLLRFPETRPPPNPGGDITYSSCFPVMVFRVCVCALGAIAAGDRGGCQHMMCAMCSAPRRRARATRAVVVFSRGRVAQAQSWPGRNATHLFFQTKNGRELDNEFPLQNHIKHRKPRTECKFLVSYAKSFKTPEASYRITHFSAATNTSSKKRVGHISRELAPQNIDSVRGFLRLESAFRVNFLAFKTILKRKQAADLV